MPIITINNKEIDNLLEKYDKEWDAEKRIKILQEIDGDNKPTIVPKIGAVLIFASGKKDFAQFPQWNNTHLLSLSE